MIFSNDPKTLIPLVQLRLNQQQKEEEEEEVNDDVDDITSLTTNENPISPKLSIMNP